MKNALIKRVKKQYKDSDDDGLIAQLEVMSDEQFDDFLIIHDKNEIEELLKKDLITLKLKNEN